MTEPFKDVRKFIVALVVLGMIFLALIFKLINPDLFIKGIIIVTALFIGGNSLEHIGNLLKMIKGGGGNANK